MQQVAGDARTRFDNSLTNVQYPDRSPFLEDLAKKIGSNSKLPSIEEIERLWFELQREIATEHNQSYMGKEIEVLVEGEHEETELLIKGRHRGQAPDVDGNVLINETNGKELKVGDIVKARVTEVLDFDVVAEIL